MGILKHTPPWAVADCECCPPGQSTKEVVTVTTPLPIAARHAFLFAVREQRLSRDLLQRILALQLLRQRLHRTGLYVDLEPYAQ